MSTQQIRLVLADDHSVMREGIREILTADGRYEIVGEAASCRQTQALVAETRPHVLLLDMTLTDGNALPLVSRLSKAYPETRIIVLSVDTSISSIHKSFEAGAWGYIAKSSGSSRIKEGIAAVMRGELYTDGTVAEVLLKHVRVPPGGAWGDEAGSKFDSLTDRERQVFQMLIRGGSTKEIAVELELSSKTVETHRLNLFTKLGAHDAIDLVRYAARLGFIDPEEWVTDIEPEQ